MTGLVACVGPESSGKSTLSAALASRLGAVWVPELARQLMRPGETYDLSDVEAIARAQLHAERSALGAGHGPIVLDTDLIVIAVWCDVRFGQVPDWIEAAIANARPRLWLLLRPDMPWEPDALRENPHDRDALFERYAQRLQGLTQAAGSPHRLVVIAGEHRLKQALAAVADCGVT